jgi:hypothetical protein
MSRNNRVFRLLPALALTAVMAGGVPAQARPAAPMAHRGGIVQADWEPFSAFWTVVSRLWEGPRANTHGLRSVAGAEGASLDPHGGTGTGTAVSPGQTSGSH